MSQTEDPRRGRAQCDQELHPYIDKLKAPVQLSADLSPYRTDNSQSVPELQQKYQEEKYGTLKHEILPLNDENGNAFELSIFTPSDKPAPTDGRPCLYFIHGGGFMINNQSSGVDSIFPCIANLNAVCVSVGYSLAPEAKAPVQLKQCYAGLMKFINDNKGSKHINLNKIVVIGRSAGAALLVGLNLMILEKTDIKIKCNVMSFPFLDNKCATKSYEDFSEAPYLSRDLAKYFWEQYGAKDGQVSELIVPALVSTERLRTFPPTLVERAVADVLSVEAEEFKAKLSSAGVDAPLHSYNGYHCFDNTATKIAGVVKNERLQFLKTHMA